MLDIYKKSPIFLLIFDKTDVTGTRSLSQYEEHTKGSKCQMSIVIRASSLQQGDRMKRTVRSFLCTVRSFLCTVRSSRKKKNKILLYFAYLFVPLPHKKIITNKIKNYRKMRRSISFWMLTGMSLTPPPRTGTCSRQAVKW
jgi:hypothetical protein